jgi:hypothetical protein
MTDRMNGPRSSRIQSSHSFSETLWWRHAGDLEVDTASILLDTRRRTSEESVMRRHCAGKGVFGAFLVAVASVACTASLGLLGCGSSATQSSPDAGVSGPNPACAGAAPCEAACASCDGQCVDLTTDLGNCGGCGAMCNQGLSCAAGKCSLVCSSGQTICSSACVDLSADATNCGECGKACSGGVCAEGACSSPTVLASGLGLPVGLAVDATSVYFCQSVVVGVDSEPTLVFRVPIGGGAAVSLNSTPDTYDTTVQTGASGNVPLAVDATSVYWGDGAGVHKIPISGGTTTLLASAPEVSWLQVDSASAYFLSDGTNIGKVPLGGGTVTSLAPISPVFGDGTGVALGASGVYWITDSLRETPLTGATTTVVSAGVPSSFDVLTVDSTSATWFSSDVAMGFNGNPMTTATTFIVAPLGPGSGGGNWKVGGPTMDVLDAAVDGDFVYFVDSVGGTINRVSKSQGTVTTLALGQSDPTNIVVDSASVYWLNAAHGGGSPSLLKIAK